MATRTSRTPRRTEALSRERIVEAAVALLDAEGESGLTFRTLTERLATGPGAIYWHVANKGELLAAATDSVIADVLAIEHDEPSDTPQDEIRTLALGLFDAIADHPWLSAQLAVQLSGSPWGSVTPRIFESFGQRVAALGVPEATWFTAASALMHYVFGAAGQNAANARALEPGVDRAEFLHAAATVWEELDPGEYPFMKSIADQVREHDDREQFLTGVDLILTGITASNRA
ncbi:TetR/AcrR family transcriptional regulator [Amycolatopsis regifaucium]|uniref:TetR family transcriptional regulator n=1 Tax=Amycolatopsis regifaucium TaxID=546365 RepID=A0A154MQW5_9PSEU|nr:TetR/AcrR family transcriptional regulator [Amycolatopsis regifaucium]KZB86197.1 TetR family transcriptional regulator [Amycolatopsis regifaucium]OKA05088.1 TetR family transcriptional regulator [Amycolatopsis regifaucium]SFH81569.1 Tetracyclin repressor, C-terminal all-alpha domain [Amycolatopsis regifaucium]